ncbi:MAG: hypothetical protein ACK53L_12625, partial [Pirellulaceae bacterium]
TDRLTDEPSVPTSCPTFVAKRTRRPWLGQSAVRLLLDARFGGPLGRSGNDATLPGVGESAAFE